MPRAAGMVKSTASQQQDTIRDINRPKSWTAGIWRGRGRRMWGWSGLQPREPVDSVAKGTRGPRPLPKAGRGSPRCWEDSRWPGRTLEGKGWCQGT